MNSKISSLKEKLRQALASTVRVISDDFKIKQNNEDNKSSNKFDFFEIDNLNNKIDFIKMNYLIFFLIAQFILQILS